MRHLLLLAGVAAAIGMAAPAHADVNDDNEFLKQLHDAGITYQDRDLAITAAHSVCQLLDGGKSAQEIVTELKNRNPSFQGNGAAEFTTLSANAYCPKYLAGSGEPEPPEAPAKPAGN